MSEQDYGDDDLSDDFDPPGPEYQMAEGVPCPESERVTAILTDLIAELREMAARRRRHIAGRHLAGLPMNALGYMTDKDLTVIGVTPCSAEGSHCRCIENRALLRAYRIGREDERNGHVHDAESDDAMVILEPGDE